MHKPKGPLCLSISVIIINHPSFILFCRVLPSLFLPYLVALTQVERNKNLKQMKIERRPLD